MQVWPDFSPLSVPLKKMEALVLPGLRRNEDGVCGTSSEDRDHIAALLQMSDKTLIVCSLLVLTSRAWSARYRLMSLRYIYGLGHLAENQDGNGC